MKAKTPRPPPERCNSNTNRPHNIHHTLNTYHNKTHPHNDNTHNKHHILSNHQNTTHLHYSNNNHSNTDTKTPDIGSRNPPPIKDAIHLHNNHNKTNNRTHTTGTPDRHKTKPQTTRPHLPQTPCPSTPHQLRKHPYFPPHPIT
ncbi:probable serine/threonine-protein kinase fhkB [Macrobrachium nipponense]|uniref:probable serine/threonine-protein kinase fhkB n=1 Tax=Macrobrachium nipponense TaxID=159736 RepID=UPI0030C8C4EB